MDPKLYKAAKEGDVNCLSRIDGRNITEEQAELIQDGKFCKRTQHGNNNILHIAARAGHGTFVAEALQRFPFLSDRENSQGDTPLLVAARYGHLKVVKILAEPNNESQMQDGMASAVGNGTNSRSRRQRDVEEGLYGHQLEQGATQDTVATVKDATNPRDTSLDNGTSLSRSRGQTEEEEEQVDHQLDAEERPVDHQPDVRIPQLWRVKNSKQDTTALHEAVRNGHERVAQFLFKKDPEMATLVNGAGESPLFLAAESNCQLFMRDVLQSNQPYSTKGPHGLNALHAARLCNGTITNELIRQKPDLLRQKDNHGKAAIHYAVEADCDAFLRLMVKADASIALFPDANGYTPLLRAASRGLVGACRYILQKCPESIEARNDKGQHALHLAHPFNYSIGSKFLKIPEIKELLNVSDDEGNSPLHLAVKKNQYEKVMLLTSGENIDLGAINKEGRTALDICESDWRHISRKNMMWSTLKKLGAPHGRHPNEHKVPSGHRPGSVHEEADAADLKPFNKTILLVATLIATITFAAAFTIPGGFKINGPHEGTAVLLDKAALQVFIVSDTVAMSCSLSVVFLLSKAMLREPDAAQVLGVLSWHFLRISLVATLVAFMSGIFAVISSKALWLAILVCIVCPLACFTILRGYGGASYWPLANWPIILKADFQRLRQRWKRMKIRRADQVLASRFFKESNGYIADKMAEF